MQTIVRTVYGGPDVLQFAEMPVPTPADGDVVVKVHAAALNPLDWHVMRGTPYVMRLASGINKPKSITLGVDFAGIVEAVGGHVTAFKPGDAVFGGAAGALAEYVAVRADRSVVAKPARLTFEEAAAVNVAGISALQALRGKAHVQSGESVLINGAAGGVGTFAVQIAKAIGAVVTAVQSARNVELVRALGADHVIDYARQDFTTTAARYDVVLDLVGNRSLAAFRRVLGPKGRYVMIGGGGVDDHRWVGPLVRMAQMFALAPFTSQRLESFMASTNRRDLESLAALIEAGTVKPVVDRCYPFNEVVEAMRYLESGRARGKVVVTIAAARP